MMVPIAGHAMVKTWIARIYTVIIFHHVWQIGVVINPLHNSGAYLDLMVALCHEYCNYTPQYFWFYVLITFVIAHVTNVTDMTVVIDIFSSITTLLIINYQS